MRKIIPLNHNWHFTKTPYADLSHGTVHWRPVSLPHTWNAVDGADGGGEYYRGECCYKTVLRPAALLAGTPWADYVGDCHEGRERSSLPRCHAFLRIGALSLRGDVYINGRKLGSHEGGYSAFTVDLTREFGESCHADSELELIVAADNANHSHIYPQMADFTFYGGLYRGVELLLLPEVHFDVAFHAAKGLAVSCELPEDSDHALIHLNSFVTAPSEDYTVRYQIVDRDGAVAAECWRPASDAEADLLFPRPHLWQGVDDPYLYRCTATLVRRNEQVDHVSTTFGIREFYVDSEKGFFLNKKPMMLRGVSRHQDWLYEGYALTREQHFRDAELIRDVGANTVRLAHYQHSEDFYDACDEFGFIVWAEIPYISCQSDDPAAHENACSQMKDLIYQNYNHPSICFWGLSNEITIGGEKPGLREHHESLNALVKECDPTRLTTMAHVSMLPMNSELHGITDVESYNHYFGWYGGSYEHNEKWLDEFHDKHPDICLGLSEYGAEGVITYQPDVPRCRDYSERYQAEYHEHMAKILMERPYLWSTYVWNMFDFGCAARDEGGTAGRNNKGLVTMDRQIKKDAFFVYKAYWSKEPFVYLCGRRYAKRPGSSVDLKVYSNQPQVSLYRNGELFATQVGSRVFLFEAVPLEEGFTHLTAVADGCSDTVTLEQVEEKPAVYTLPFDEEAGDGAANWFDQIETVASDAPMEFSATHFSVYDKLEDLLAHEEAARILSGALSAMSGMKLQKSMLAMMRDKTVVELAGMFAAMGNTAAPDNALQIVNAELNKITKLRS
ncbi:MAG: hypothetical protein NC399_10065 [Muribaculum sp.]|nr:hypothetical protein [Muribaculum sp.]